MVACQNSGEQPQPFWENKENILHFDVNYEFDTLNPTIIESSGSTSVFPLMYSYLCVLNPTGEMVPDLAVGWNYDAINFVWTIRLRTDARFHTGILVTAWDVAYSFKMISENLLPGVGLLVEKIQIPSASTIVFKLKNDDPLFLQKIRDFEIVPDPTRHTRIEFFNSPVGSGPFRFKEREGRQTVVLEANPEYYNGRPPLNGVIFHFIAAREKSWTRLLRGVTDVAGELNPQNYKMIQQYKDRFYFHEYVLPYYAIMLYNTHHPLFNDPDVRRALTLAIDRKHIVDSILSGYGKIASGPMGIGSPYHNPSVVPLPYNPTAALRILKNAGWSFDPVEQTLAKSGQLFTFELLVTEKSDLDLRIASFIRICLDQINIRMNIKTLSFTDIKRGYYRNSDFEATLVELQGIYRNFDFLLDQWTTSDTGKGMAGGFESQKTTAIIRSALNAKNIKLRTSLLHQVDERIAALHPGTFLFQKTALDAMSKRFIIKKPFAINLSGIYRLRFANLKTGSNLLNK